MKLIPGVQISNDEVRGPSAGGSGQDNVYQFDGVNVTLPLFGTLSARALVARHRPDLGRQGRRQGVDFNRSGGFTIDSVSKSGTNDFHGRGELPGAAATSMTSDRETGSSAQFERGQDWAVAQPRRPDPARPAVLLRLVLPADRRARQPLQRLRRGARLRERARRALRQALLHADRTILLHGSYRDSEREINADTRAPPAPSARPHAGSTSSGSDATSRSPSSRARG